MKFPTDSERFSSFSLMAANSIVMGQIIVTSRLFGNYEEDVFYCPG